MSCVQEKLLKFGNVRIYYARDSRDSRPVDQLAAAVKILGGSALVCDHINYITKRPDGVVVFPKGSKIPGCQYLDNYLSRIGMSDLLAATYMPSTEFGETLQNALLGGPQTDEVPVEEYDRG